MSSTTLLSIHPRAGIGFELILRRYLLCHSVIFHRYYYKFCIDGDWGVDDKQPVESNVRKNSYGAGHKIVKANVITVKPEDHEVFEALACDSFAVKPYTTSDEDGWGQNKPKNLGGLPARLIVGSRAAGVNPSSTKVCLTK